jgi:hypothetical protein
MAGVVAGAEVGFHWMSLENKEDRQEQKEI